LSTLLASDTDRLTSWNGAPRITCAGELADLPLRYDHDRELPPDIVAVAKVQQLVDHPSPSSTHARWWSGHGAIAGGAEFTGEGGLWFVGRLGGAAHLYDRLVLRGDIGVALLACTRSSGKGLGCGLRGSLDNSLGYRVLLGGRLYASYLVPSVSIGARLQSVSEGGPTLDQNQPKFAGTAGAGLAYQNSFGFEVAYHYGVELSRPSVPAHLIWLGGYF
jgi:hypothetical protein